MSTRDREENHWREMRKQLVEMWNREGTDPTEADDEGNLQARVPISHHGDDPGRKTMGLPGSRRG